MKGVTQTFRFNVVCVAIPITNANFEPVLFEPVNDHGACIPCSLIECVGTWLTVRPGFVRKSCTTPANRTDKLLLRPGMYFAQLVGVFRHQAAPGAY